MLLFLYISQCFSSKWETESTQECFAAFKFIPIIFPCWYFFCFTPLTCHSKGADNCPVHGQSCYFHSSATRVAYMSTTKTYQANISGINATNILKPQRPGPQTKQQANISTLEEATSSRSSRINSVEQTAECWVNGSLKLLLMLPSGSHSTATLRTFC